MSQKDNMSLKFIPLNKIKSVRPGIKDFAEVRMAIPNELAEDYLLNPNKYIGGLIICPWIEYEKEKKRMEDKNV